MTSGTLQIETIRTKLRTDRIGRRIEYVESTPSTNDEAWRRTNTDDADGSVVFAEYQSAGRGRLGRPWHSPRGASLLCSVLLIDDCAELTGGELGLVAAVAACNAVTACTDVAVTIKWPNDLMVAGRKLGGILIESRARQDGIRAFVIGIGINCLQHHGHLAPVLGESATSLELESATAVDRIALAVALLLELDLWLGDRRSWDDGRLHREWLARAGPMGSRIRLQHGGRLYSGSMIDVDPGAALVVRLDDGNVRAFDAATTTVIATSTTSEHPPVQDRVV